MNESEGLLENVNPNMWPCDNKMFEVDKVSLGAYQMSRDQQLKLKNNYIDVELDSETVEALISSSLKTFEE